MAKRLDKGVLPVVHLVMPEIPEGFERCFGEDATKLMLATGHICDFEQKGLYVNVHHNGHIVTFGRTMLEPFGITPIGPVDNPEADPSLPPENVVVGTVHHISSPGVHGDVLVLDSVTLNEVSLRQDGTTGIGFTINHSHTEPMEPAKTSVEFVETDLDDATHLKTVDGQFLVITAINKTVQWVSFRLNSEQTIDTVPYNEIGRFGLIPVKAKPPIARWRARHGDNYWAINDRQRPQKYRDLRGLSDDQSYKEGNYFRTEERCKNAILRQKSMIPTCPFPVEGQYFWTVVSTGKDGFECLESSKMSEIWKLLSYNLGRLFASREIGDEWITVNGPAWLEEPEVWA